MKKILILSLLLCFFFVKVKSEPLDSISSSELGFVNHLMKIKDFKSAIFTLDKMNISSSNLEDSAYFMKAICYFNMQIFDSASKYFDKINPEFNSNLKSSFLSALSKVHIKKYHEALTVLNRINVSDSNIIKLRNLEIAGIYLLNRDLDSFQLYASAFDYTYYIIARQEKSLTGYFDDIKKKSGKSMFLAGAMSTVIPGSGKVYAGRAGDGISSFLSTVVLGLVAYENYKKDGMLNYKTLFFSSLFSVFYIGNIWGSVFSIKMEDEDFKNEIDHKILLDLHYPLHTVFN